MVRLALVLLALSGCDIAVGLEPITAVPGACGPYTKVTDVPINGVTEARGFSINAEETMALVNGKDGAGQTRPIVLVWNNDAWEPEPTMQRGLVSGMKGANLAPDEAAPIGASYTGPMSPVMLLSTGTTKLQVARYYFNTTAPMHTWTQDINEPEFSLSGYDVYPGNVVARVGTGGPDDRVRHTVMLLAAQDPTQDANKIEITANSPPSYTLEDKARTIGLNSMGFAFSQAVMTEDRAKLVYSAKFGEHADIYAVAQGAESRTFDEQGGAVTPVDTDDDEVEPWINADCSKMYFRRIPADAPNDAGRILVAE